MPSDQIIALVTGGARRVGAAIVNELSTAGFAVGIHCHRSGADAERLRTAIEARGGRAVVIEADLSDPEACEGLIDKAAARLGGPVRLLVNNASAFEPDTAAEIDWAAWRLHFALHLEVPVRLAARFAAQLSEAGQTGLIVNMVDQRVRKPTPDFFSYALSKASLDAATRTMAQSFAPHIRVNAIGPGPTLPNPRQVRADFEAQASAVILGRGPQLPEFGRTITYLWNSPSITGQTIMLDGGQHLAWQTPDVVGIKE